jgi:Arc/MetJ-type ribon-helix-helix transcriptional regulator
MKRPAHYKLSDWFRSYVETAEAEPQARRQASLVKLLERFSALADESYAACKTDEQKLEVLASILQVNATILAECGHASAAVVDLFNSVANIRLGRPADISFAAAIRSGTYNIREEFIRLLILELWLRYPDEKTRYRLLQDAKKQDVGLNTKSSIRKFVANVKNSRAAYSRDSAALRDIASKQIKEKESPHLLDYIP